MHIICVVWCTIDMCAMYFCIMYYVLSYVFMQSCVMYVCMCYTDMDTIVHVSNVASDNYSRQVTELQIVADRCKFC